VIRHASGALAPLMQPVGDTPPTEGALAGIEELPIGAACARHRAGA